MPYTCAKAPCKSCPYRKDVPSGVWAAVEYDKLPAYDGDIGDQLLKGGTGLFMCHQQDGHLCAGWVGAHDPKNSLAMRLHHREVDRSVWDYKSPVPLFESGAAARAHGMQDIPMPSATARRTVERLLRTRQRKHNQ